jgi:D-arabinose 1-dehydrogenase-like Zn-dependent alcohol dehydrogenase
MGQMAILIAKAMGNTVVAFSSQDGKEEFVHQLGAEFCGIADQKRRAQYAGACNIILDTRTNEHQVKDTLDIVANSGIIVELSMNG